MNFAKSRVSTPTPWWNLFFLFLQDVQVIMHIVHCAHVPVDEISPAAKF